MTTQTTIHNAAEIRVTQWMPGNANAIELAVTTLAPVYVDTVGVVKAKDQANILMFDLPERVTDALRWALPCFNETDRDRAEELAERIEQVLSDTNDMDVSFADFGLAVACDLLGIDRDEIYAARRKDKESAA